MINKETLDLYKLGIRIGLRKAATSIRWDTCDETRPGFREFAEGLAEMLQRAADDELDPDDRIA